MSPASVIPLSQGWSLGGMYWGTTRLGVDEKEFVMGSFWAPLDGLPLPWVNSYPQQPPHPSLSTWGKWGPAGGAGWTLCWLEVTMDPVPPQR